MRRRQYLQLNDNNHSHKMSLLPSEPPTWRLMLTILAVAFSISTPFGFYLTVINVPQEIFEQFVNASFLYEHGEYMKHTQLQALWSFIVSAFTLGGAIGAVAALPAAEMVGRKYSMFIVAGTIVLSSVASSVSSPIHSFELFTVGRFLAGLACGFGSSLLSIYLSEISPVALRGFAGGFQEVFLVLGKLLGVLLSLPNAFGSWSLWPVLVSLPCVCAVVLFVCMPWLPETPKYQRAKRRSQTDVSRAIRFYHGVQADVEQVIMHIDREIEMIQDQAGIRSVLRSALFRKTLIVALVIRVAQEITGVTVIANFSTSLFNQLGFGDSFAQWNTMGITALSLCVTVVAVCVVERLGRRPMLLLGLTGTTICNLVYMVCALLVSYGAWPGYLCMIAFYLNQVLFLLGPGTLHWLIVPELCTQNIRSFVTSTATFVGLVTKFVYGALFLPIAAWLGPGVFLLYIVPSVWCIWYLYNYLPETMDRHVEDIALDLKTRHKRTKIKWEHGMTETDKNCDVYASTTSNLLDINANGTLICLTLFMVFALVAESHSYSNHWAGYICIGLFYIHIVLFGIGPGPIPWLIVPELTPQVARSTATSTATFMNWVANLLTTVAFLPLTDLWGPWSFFIFIIPLGACIVYLWIVLPETMHREVEDIARELETRESCQHIKQSFHVNRAYQTEADC